ncbi:MAG: hypothetical protein WCG14_06085 [Chlamydiia bacterium]
MKIKRVIFILSGVIALVGVCTPWTTSQLSNIPTVETLDAESTFLRSNTIQVVAKAYTPEESTKFLNKNLLRKGYQPVQITIQNNSSQEYSLSSGSVGLPTASPSKVTMKLMQSAIPRGIAFRIASFFFWPFMVPSTIDSIITMKTYQSIKNDLQSKLVKKEVIAPYSIYNRIVFVPIDQFKDSFDVSLIELQSLRPQVIHVTGLQQGSVVYSSSDTVSDTPAQQPIYEDTQSVAE